MQGATITFKVSRETKFGYGFLFAGVALPYLIDKFFGTVPAAVFAIVCGIVAIAFLVSGHRHRDGLGGEPSGLFNGAIPDPGEIAPFPLVSPDSNSAPRPTEITGSLRL